jgi:plasmid stabilization system protein ParE
MAKLEVADGVEAELIDAVSFYDGRQPGLGQRFWREYESCLALILVAPTMYQIRAHNTRRAKLRDFPFTIIYRYDGDRIIVFAVAHLSRKPGYWKKRFG